ncbi:MAG: hypothetical protein KatS3mg126_0370 [Lysobacteraceae bacterium]|nr:MAG: hypothetical protein KatS3mg126_0370 [Xanthomonadaceae bacterium]
MPVQPSEMGLCEVPYSDIGEGEKAALVESFERIVAILKGEQG